MTTSSLGTAITFSNPLDLQPLLKELASLETFVKEEQSAFNAHKAQIISEFEAVYVAYELRKESFLVLSHTKELFITSLQRSESLQELEEVLGTLMQSLVENEILLGLTDPSKKLSVLVAEKCLALRREGKLSNEDLSAFITSIRKKVREAYLGYQLKVGDIEYSKQFFMLLEAINQADTFESVEKAFVQLREWCSSAPLSLSRNILFKLIGTAPSLAELKCAVDVLYRELIDKKLLLKPIPGYLLKNHKERLQQLKIQLKLFTQARMEQARIIIEEHLGQMSKISSSALSGKYQELFTSYTLKLMQIINQFREKSGNAEELERALSELVRDACEFWKNFMEYSDKKELKQLRSQVRQAREHLIAKKLLTRDHRLDIRFMMLEGLEKYHQTAVQGTWGKVGEERQCQIDLLKMRIYASESTDEAVEAIRQAIFEIKKKHETESLAYNVAFLRKASRTVTALNHLLEELVALKIIQKSKETWAEQLERHLELYFKTDILFSSRIRQKIKYELLEDIRNIENSDCSDFVIRQKLRERIELAIEKVNRIHQQGEGVNKALRFFGYYGNSRLGDHLQDFIAQHNLPEAYVKLIWPKANKILSGKLTALILAYSNLLEHRSENGLDEAMLLVSKLKDCGESDCAAYVLYWGIRSLKEESDYQQVADALEQGQAELRLENVLRNIEQTEFSEVYIKQLQTKFAQIKSAIMGLRQQAQKLKPQTLTHTFIAAQV
jgi:hypothetical protein